MNRILIYCRSVALLALPVLSLSTARAEVFCVGNAMELQSALWQAQSNGENDEIRVQPGHYSTEANGSLGIGFHYVTTEARLLAISGGWNDTCVGTDGTATAFDTVLDGGGVNQVMVIAAGDANAIIVVADLTIESGYQPSEALPAGGIHIKGFGQGNQAGLVVIDRVAFIENSAIFGSALTIESQRRVEVANSLFRDNTTNHSSSVIIARDAGSSGASYFINNTVVNNVALTADGSAGVAMFNPSGNVAANNVFWNNGNYDLVMYAANGSISNNHLLHNIVQNALGFGGTNIGNSTGDPKLGSDFSLLPGSPGIDAGYMPPGTPNPPVELNWVLRDFDISRLKRNIGPSVDIGAFESSYLFSDRFE